jgi:hypothetical protein
VGSVADLFPSSLKVFIKKKKKNGVLLLRRSTRKQVKVLVQVIRRGGPPRAVVLTFGGGRTAARPTADQPTGGPPHPHSVAAECRYSGGMSSCIKKKRIPIIHPSGSSISLCKRIAKLNLSIYEKLKLERKELSRREPECMECVASLLYKKKMYPSSVCIYVCIYNT